MKCFIIGYPLNKPRSVVLWKSFFKKKKLYEFTMNPMEVKKKNAKKIINSFLVDKNFFASAVTMPLKKELVKYVKFGNSLTKIAGSINLILKVRKNLIGYNTDIFAALKTIQKIKNKKKILIIGLGGTGKPLAKVLAMKFKKSEIVCVSSKKHKDLLSNKNIDIKKNILKVDLSSSNLIINCTPIGSNLTKSYEKLSPITQKELNLVDKKANVFDIIYKPRKTLLSKFCEKRKIKYHNGINMNTLQAKEALNIIYKNYKGR